MLLTHFDLEIYTEILGFIFRYCLRQKDLHKDSIVRFLFCGSRALEFRSDCLQQGN
jgi:hypothetical protein